MKILNNMRARIILVLLGSILNVLPASGLAQVLLYGIDNQNGALSVIDPVTGATQSTVGVTLVGETINNANGLAVNPVTNEMYAAVKLASQAGPGRNLLLVNPETGVATNVGNMGQPIASLAFDSNGVLYAVSGDCLNNCGGAAVAETLFTVNLNDASLTTFQTLGNGNDGEAIAYNPDDGMMYHLSGIGSEMVFEKINLSNGTVTAVPFSGDSRLNLEAIGFTYDAAASRFVGGLIDWSIPAGDFIHLTAGGNLDLVADLDSPWKDYAFWDSNPPHEGMFIDVPPEYWAFSFIETLGASGITAGCGGGNYCPLDPVTRAQMAVFLERGMNGSGYSPPAATGNVFLDVGAQDFAASFIEQLFADGITAGCGNNNYCPNSDVTRDQMAVFLLRAKHGSGYSPPAATGVFNDVPLSYWAVHWIEQLAAEGITAGCGGGNYCPEAQVTRDQMAVFLVRTFGL